jgi:putative heme iron utilization protein
MSERLDARAEVLKLARLLDVKPDELSYLSGLPAAELRDFRDKATDRLFTSAPGLARAAAAARLIPSGLVATIAQRAFGAMLCARAAGGADTAKAIDVAKRLPAEFLADVAVHLDPRRTAEIIAEVPEEIVVPVAEELGRRREHVTMGRFLAFVPDNGIAAAIGALDDETMLRTAFVLEHKDRLDHAIGLLPPERLPGIIDTASRLELWSEALDLLSHVSDERKGPIAEVVAELPEETVASLVGAVTADGLWETLLPVVRLMAEDARVRIAAMAPFHEPEVLGEILLAATSEDADALWVDLVPLVDALPEEAHLRIAGLVTTLDARALSVIIRDAAEAPYTLDTLLRLVARMEPEDRDYVTAAIADAFADLPDPALTGILHAATGEDADGLWVDLVPLLDTLPAEAHARIARLVTTLEPRALEVILRDATGAPDTLATLLRLVGRMDADGRQVVVAAIDAAERPLGETLLAGLTDPADVGRLVPLVPEDVMAAVRRAAERLEMTAELDAALAAAERARNR